MLVLINSTSFTGATLKRTRREVVLNQGDFSGTIEDVADLSGDEWNEPEEAASQDMKKKDKKKKKTKKPKVDSPADSSDESKEMDEEEEDEPFLPPVDGLQELESKPDDLDNMATCFFKDVWYEKKKYTFVYLKRKNKCVNVQMSCLPWLIQKLSFYYSIRGTDLCKALAALNEGRNRIIQAMRANKCDNVDLVKELKITKRELAGEDE